MFNKNYYKFIINENYHRLKVLQNYNKPFLDEYINYEKEFDSYYMIIKKVQYNDMAEEIVYSYEIDIYFKDEVNELLTNHSPF